MTALGLYEEAKYLGLEIPFPMLSAEEVTRIYNGVGAEWMPDELRNALDGLSNTLLPAVLVHDLDYAYGDGTLLDFMRANERLEKNGRICADAEYGWYNPLRYLVRRQAKAYRRLCHVFGMPAYLAAIEENGKHQTKAKEV